MANPPIKFVKSIEADLFDLTPAQGSRWFFKVIYEFWAHVINGNDDPLASGSGFAVSGGIQVPENFTSGSTLLGIGSDGITSFGSNTLFSPSTDFAAMNATGSLIGKHIVMWKSGSESYDDGIYKILYVDSTNRIVLDPRTGGTPRRGNHATFWSRSGIRFRIIDINAAARLPGWDDQQGLTLQFDGASDVNSGQRSSQFHFQMQQSQSYFASMSISPSGTWNVNHFVDSGSNIAVRFFNTVSGRPLISVAGAKDFLTCHVKGVDNTLQGTSNVGSGFHVEIPKRLYPQENDPNPITFMAYGITAVSQITGTYHTGFRMIGADGVHRTWTTLVRSPFGDHTNTSFAAANQGIYQGLVSSSLASKALYDPYSDKRLLSDGLLHLNVSGQFSLARVRLRHVRFSAQQHSGEVRGRRFGSEWIHFMNGILWPWNNTRMPYGRVPWEGA